MGRQGTAPRGRQEAQQQAALAPRSLEAIPTSDEATQTSRAFRGARLVSGKDLNRAVRRVITELEWQDTMLEAQRAMNACASCHAESDCVQCHGALGIGAGVSPHPPGFASRCRAALDRNARACVTCHGDIAALRGRCL